MDTDDSTVDWKPQYDVPHSAACEIVLVAGFNDPWLCHRAGPGYVVSRNQITRPLTGRECRLVITVDGRASEWLVRVTGQGMDRDGCFRTEFDVLKYPEGK